VNWGSRCNLGEGSVIGLPRALLFYELYPFWRAMFRELNLRLLVTPPTSRSVVERGAGQAVDEACLPVKVFYGHVMSLRDRVDAVFLPRVVSLQRGTYTCPKLLGLPDMIRHNVGRLPRAIIADFDETKKGRGLAVSALALARRLGRGPRRARDGVAGGMEALRRFRAALSGGLTFEKAVRWAVSGSGSPAPVPGSWRELASHNGRIRVGLVGHPYNLFDRGVNLDLQRKLERLGCLILTSEMLSEEEVAEESRRMPKQIFWSSGRRIMAAVTKFRREELVDGIIHLESFGCGPDSVVGEIAERETKRESRLPYMALTIDEHTGEAGLVTRLEAFADMLDWHRRRRGRSAGRGGAAQAPAGEAVSRTCQ